MAAKESKSTQIKGRLGIIGAGVMGQALGKGILESHHCIMFKEGYFSQLANFLEKNQLGVAASLTKKYGFVNADRRVGKNECEKDKINLL